MNNKTTNARSQPEMSSTTEIINQLSLIDGILVTALTNIIALIGSVGNVLNVIILRKHGLHNSTNIILLSLAVADLLYLLTSPMRNLSKYIKAFDEGMAITVDTYVFSYAMILNSIFSVSSMTHIVVIAIERLIAIFFPFRVSRWMTPYRMAIIAISAHVVWYPIWIPLMFRINVEWITNPLLNQTVAVPVYSDFYIDNVNAFEAFYNYFLMMFTGPLYCLVVFCCCIATSVKLVHVSRKRSNIVSVHNKDGSFRNGVNIKAVRMLIVVCCVYLVATLPPTMFQVLQTTGATVYIDEAKSYSAVLLWCLNSSANFIIYVIMSAKFKATFKEMIQCRNED